MIFPDVQETNGRKEKNKRCKRDEKEKDIRIVSVASAFILTFTSAAVGMPVSHVFAVEETQAETTETQTETAET